MVRSCLLLFLAVNGLWAQFTPVPHEAYYRTLTLQTPTDAIIEVGGLAPLPDGRLAVATRRGEVWILAKPTAEPPTAANLGWSRFAEGLHEILGLTFHDGALYATQRSEVTRLTDRNADGRADEYLCASSGWGVSGAYHEYAYGPVFDAQGNMHNTLNCSMGKTWKGAGEEAKHPLWRGWSIMTPKGYTKPVGFSAGYRSPSGLCRNAAGEIFANDQQGNWVPTSPIIHVQQGAFYGHADALGDQAQTGSLLKQRPEVREDLSVAKAITQIKGYHPPAVWLPYIKFGQSTTGMHFDETAGRFGPFTDQLFVGEFVFAGVNRVSLQRVRGQYQGACYPFVSALQCAVLSLNFLQDGSMIVGQTNRGWNSYGDKPQGLQRLIPTGKVPFEVLRLEAIPGGFEFTFTKPVRANSAWGQTKAQSYTYQHHGKYGSPEIESEPLRLNQWSLSPDGLRLSVACENLRAGFVHEFELPPLISSQGEKIWHQICAYTLNQLP
jgi:glucose/arabinose dehydrogenase